MEQSFLAKISTRPPPFSPDNALRSYTEIDADLPIALQYDDEFVHSTTDMATLMHFDLHTPKLDCLHKWLWTAGLMRPARPLHRQRQLKRTIFVTERPDEHLVWHEGVIFVKPLPEYLLSHSFWVSSICPRDAALYNSALGMLLSYTWLIRSKPDLRVAHETGLLPANIEWHAWSWLARDVIKTCETLRENAKVAASDLGYKNNLDEPAWRYDYGELRLSRLSRLYRFGFAGFTARNLTGGFTAGSQRYTTVFKRNFGWLIVIFAYLSIVLSALQVALATSQSAADERFQALSYGVAVASLAVVFFVAVLAFMVWTGLFWYHVLSTRYYHQQVMLKRRR